MFKCVHVCMYMFLWHESRRGDVEIEEDNGIYEHERKPRGELGGGDQGWGETRGVTMKPYYFVCSLKQN